MPTLTFLIGKDGLILPIYIGLSGQAMSELAAKGQPLPAPVLCRGLVDTGSSISSIDAWIIKHLDLGPGRPAQTETASGKADVALHTVSISITDTTQSNEGLTLPTVLVMRLPRNLSDADVLIGLDVLSECDLLLEGKARRFSLRF